MSRQQQSCPYWVFIVLDFNLCLECLMCVPVLWPHLSNNWVDLPAFPSVWNGKHCDYAFTDAGSGNCVYSNNTNLLAGSFIQHNSVVKLVMSLSEA